MLLHKARILEGPAFPGSAGSNLWQQRSFGFHHFQKDDATEQFFRTTLPGVCHVQKVLIFRPKIEQLPLIQPQNCDSCGMDTPALDWLGSHIPQRYLCWADISVLLVCRKLEIYQRGGNRIQKERDDFLLCSTNLATVLCR